VLRGLPHIKAAGLPAARMRLVGLSATMPNVRDIGAFFEAPRPFAFPDSYRPVPLTVHVCGYPAAANPFLFDRGLMKHVAGVVARHSDGLPALIFCGSRKDAEAVAKSLADGRDWSAGARGGRQAQVCCSG
jgi:replicative superfamily II helicase